jgi:RimJ/RimL family protein N-acetyltransferase
VLDCGSWRVTLETERLVLAPLTAGDAEEMVEVLSDPALYRFTGGEPPSLAELRARYERQALGAPPDGSEVWANWIVRLRDGGAAVGYVQATVGPDGGDLAFVIGTRWQGRGYAGEAAVSAAAFLREAGVAPLTAHVHPSHQASQRVAVRVGLMRRGQVDAEGEEVWEG